MNRVYHKPYFPPDVPDCERQKPYICRLAPSKTSITFEWFDLSNGSEFKACYRKFGFGKFCEIPISEGTVTIENLKSNCEYELFVQNERGIKSNVRLFRTCSVPAGAVVVNYLHPKDKQYAFSGRFLCSPHMIRLPCGRILASNDVFESDDIPKLTILYYSDDSGKTWHYFQDIFPFFWGAFFSYDNKLYLFGGTAEKNGDLQIICSEDEGYTWSLPTILIDGKSIPKRLGSISKGAFSPVLYNGRYYTSVEYCGNGNGVHYPQIISFAAGDNPMEKDSWIFSDVLNNENNIFACDKFIPEYIEGNIIVNPNGELEEIRRIMPQKYARLKINTSNPAAAPELISVDNAPVSNSLFRIFSRNGIYYLVTNRESVKKFKYSILNGRNIWDKIDRFKRCITHRRFTFNRNILSVFKSKDTKTWEFVTDIVNRENVCPKDEGYQYPAIIAEEKLFVLVRSSFNLADSQHNSNYTLFFSLDV